MSTAEACIDVESRKLESPVVNDAIDVRLLGKQMDEMLRSSPDVVEATGRFVRFTRRLVSAVVVLHYANDSTGQLSTVPLCRDPESLDDAALNQLYALALRTQQQQTAQLAQGQGGDPRLAMALPVFCRDGQVEVLLAVVASGKSELHAIALHVQLLQLIASYLGQWRGSGWSQQLTADDDATRRCLATISLANRADRFSECATIVAQHLASESGVAQVALMLRRTGGLYRLLSLAPEIPFERGAPLVTSLEAVAGEIGAAGDGLYASAEDQDLRATDAIGELFATSKADAMCGIPLRDAKGAIQGAVVLLSEQPIDPAIQQRCIQDVDLLGPHLLNLRARRTSRWQQLRSRFAALSKQQRRAATVGLAALVIASCIVPIPYRVKCSCELQSISRRYVTAPYEGVLKETLVAPGEMVSAGQVLARMDDSDLLFKRDAIIREIKSWENKATGALAGRENDKHFVAMLERETKEASLKDVDRMLSLLEIKSPMEGYVISGDLERLEGAHLNVGQTLFEVGPLGQLLVEVAIPDQDIEQLQSDQAASFRLDALPFTSFRGRLTRIAPRSELRANHNVFIGEIEFQNAESSLRPGMRGHAKINAGYRPLVWILFHRAVERALFRLGW